MSDVVGQIALELGIDSSQVARQLTGAANRANKQATSAFAGIGKKIAAGLSVAAFAKFTKDCIEVGSSVTEVQNVVDTAFGNLSSEADRWASNAMTNFGLSELSAKKYMGVFGQMSSAMGITGQAALDMSEQVTGLVGDVASFYNLGTDEAYTKLKSIWTGETETLKDLGVVMTQTNLDQYALNNGFGKTTAKMTEQEKVMLRYQYVTSALSNASGDFIKTQDSWANQTRILTLRFEQLKASLGKGFIALFTPILRGLNNLLAGLQKAADGFAAFTQMLTGADISVSMGSVSSDIAGIGDTASDAAAGVSGIGDAAKDTAKEVEKSLTGFDQIEKLTEPSSDSGGSGTSSGTSSSVIGSSSTNVASEIDKAGTKLESLKKIIGDVAQELKKSFKYGLGKDFDASIKRQKKHLLSIKDDLVDIYTDRKVVSAAKKYFDSLVKNAGRVTGAFTSIGASISENLLGGIDRYLSKNKEFIKNRLSEIFDASAVLSDKIGDYYLFLSRVSEVFRSDTAKGISADLISIFTNPFMTIKSLFAHFTADITTLFVDPLVNNTDKVKEAFERTLVPVKNVLDGISATLTNVCEHAIFVYDEHIKPLFETFTQGLDKLLSKVLDVYNNYIAPVIDNVSDKVVNMWQEHIEPVMLKIQDVIGSVADCLNALWQNVLEPLVTWVIDNVVPCIAPVIEFVSDMVINTVSTMMDKLNSFLDLLKNILNFVTCIFKGDWVGAWDSIVNAFGGIFGMIVDIAKSPINMIIGLINGMLTGIESGINFIVSRVNSLGFDVPDWVPGIGGKRFGFNLPEVSFGKIPYLAQGGYVKPNTPQLAMIGDNRHQGEVVAPEDKLRDMAVQAAQMSSNAALLQEAISVLKEILKVITALDLDIQIDGVSLKKYIVNKINEHTKATGKCEIIT